MERPSGSAPLAIVHPILIGSGIAAALGYAAWELRDYARTGEASALVIAGIAAVVAIGFAMYLRSLRGLSARLSPRGRAVWVTALLVPATVHAGSITLETTLTPTVGDTLVTVTVAVRNTGTDTANNVKPKLRLGDEERTGDLVRELAPQKRREWTFEFPRPAHPGRLPVLSTVAYNDGGFRSFSAISAALADVGEPVPPRLHGSMESVELSGAAKAKVSITNDADVAREVRLALALPEELGGWRDLGIQRQEPGQTRELRVAIENSGALAGSRYAVWAVARTVDGDRETVQLLPAMATVTTPRGIDWQSNLGRIAMWLGVAFVVVEVVVQLRAFWGVAPGPG